MYPQTHFLFSFLVALIFAKFGVFDYKLVIFIALVGLFVDIDHYISFIFRRYDFSLKDAWNAHVVRHVPERTIIHHRIGFVLAAIVVAFLFFISRNLFWIFGLGYFSHMFLDFAKLNVLKIKGKITFREAGFVERISKFEILLDIFFFAGILLLIL